MAEDRIVEFSASVGPIIFCLVMTNFPLDGRGQGHVTSYFWRISVNKCLISHQTADICIGAEFSNLVS